MFKKNPILKYESSMKEYEDSIIPSKNVIPDWYKKIPRWKNNTFFDMKSGINQTVKQCIPFLDSLTVGYVITLPYDVFIKNDNGQPILACTSAVENRPTIRKNIADINLVPAGHHPIEFVWDYNVAYSLPKGYSAIFTHPLNRNDLPFTTVSAIIDGGLVMSPHGNAPFYIKKGFEGIIPQGTPIIQLIPYRQENWTSINTKGLLKESDEHNKKSSSLIYGWYKKTFWTRKKYD
jgi:hypothetical protein